MGVVGIILAIVMILSILVGANYYVAQRIYKWFSLFLPQINAKIYFGVYIALAVIMILGIVRYFLPIPLPIQNIIGWISTYWMGIFLFLLMLFLLADLALLIGSLTKIFPKPMPSNIRFISGLLVLLLTSGIVAYGAYNSRQIRHVSYDVALNGHTLSPELKIVLISDLHLGTTNNEKNLANIVEEINSLNPDIVCMAGDIFNDDFNAIQNPAEASNLLKSINSTYGVYASLGNHDGGSTIGQMINFLKESNIKLLNDEYVIIDDRLVMIGRLDPSPIGGFGDLRRKDTADLLASIDTDLPVIVMEHTPSAINQYGGEVDLILSGHTHDGQIIPGNLIVRAIYTVSYGYYQRDAGSPHVIVTSGVGTWGTPLRVGTNNEIVSILLH